MFSVLNIPIFSGSISDVVRQVDRWIKNNQRTYICVTGVHGIVASQHSNEVLKAHLRAGMVVPDGMPLVWIGQLVGQKNTERIYGPDLFLRLNEFCQTKKYRIYLYGTTEETLAKLSARLHQLIPGLIIVGNYAPSFQDLAGEETRQIIHNINKTKPNIVWIGLSTPKQELWMYEIRSKINAEVFIGVGAAFDFVSGNKKQAPIWVRRAGLEWLFRLINEPKRLWKRYLVNNTLFLYYYLRHLLWKS